jgi:hypothetical protein
MMNRVKVRILNEGNIPFIGGGPILKPIDIKESEYKVLKVLGYNIELVNININNKINYKEPSPGVMELVSKKIEKETVNVVKDTVKDIIIEKDDDNGKTEDGIEDNITILEDENNDESNEELENKTDDVLIDDPNLSPDAIYTNDFLTKKISIKILDARGINFDHNSNAEPLKRLVLETNPVR